MFERLRVKFMRWRRFNLPRGRRQLRLMSRHPSFKVPLITLGLLLVLTGAGFLLAKGTHNLPPAHDAKIVIISHDHIQQILPSKQDTVGQLIKKLNLKLNQGDVVEPALTTHINQDQFRINIYRAVPVEIVDGGNVTYTFSASKTPRAIAQQAGAVLAPEDAIVTRPVQDFVAAGAVGEQVVVRRSTPVNVDLYGTAVTLRTQAKTVGGLIREKGIKLVKNDQVVPGPDTPIAGLQHLAFIRTGTKTETVTEQIATPVQRINDPTLAYGTTAVRQQGSPGQQTVTYEISIVNNVETGRKTIQTIVTRAPVTEIDVIGTSLSGIKGDMALAGIAPGDYNYADYIISHESGWNPNASNPSGAYGLCQALPGSKMSTAGSDWATNPITQLKWCNGYALRSYGSWAGAYNHWVAYRNW
jgi:uncharacterized protein YabE (DUF348 family)